MDQKYWRLPFVGLLLVAQILSGQDFFGTGLGAEKVGPHLEVSLVSASKAIVPGQPVWVAARLEMEGGWHVYWENPGGAGAKPEIQWDLPDGFTAGEIHWPVPERHVLQGLMNYVYEGVVHLMVKITPPAEIPDSTVELKALLEWTVCSDQKCMFGDKEISLELPVGEEGGVNESVAAAFRETREAWPTPGIGLGAQALHDGKNLLLEFTLQAPTFVGQGSTPPQRLSLKILWLALLGGAILNLMPCVFPVIGLKIMGFVKQAGEDRRSIAVHGVAYTVGVLVSFWVLAGALILLRQGGQELGWGFQLQDPRFVFALAVLLLVFALNLSGLFEVGASMAGAGGRLAGKSGIRGSFFSGVFATVMSTPCAAPFLAPALGAALVLPPGASLLVFTTMALGLAFPYLLLSFFPQLVESLPRPGPWMETFKQFMAFPLYATVMFLLWTLAGQVEDWAFLAVLFVMVLMALACWILGRWPRKGLAKGLAAITMAGAAAWGFPDAPHSGSAAPRAQEAYFFSRLPLVDPSSEQLLTQSPQGKAMLQLPLAEYFSEEVEAAAGRLQGVLHLKMQGVQDLSVDAPLQRVDSTRLESKLKEARELAESRTAPPAKGLPWEKWTPDTVQEHLDAGRAVYIDFTARWCATCQVNKRVALSSERMAARFAELGIVPLKADWTKKGPFIARALAAHGRAAVPFNIIHVPDGGPPIELPEVLTVGIVLEALSQVEARMATLGGT